MSTITATAERMMKVKTVEWTSIFMMHPKGPNPIIA
jgi:hypothetical protein